MRRQILVEHRLREIERPFGWIPLRLLRDGYWEKLSVQAKILYCLLCIVSDRRGISFYGDARLLRLSGLDATELAHARDELVTRDLIAIDPASSAVQLLSLPSRQPDRADIGPPTSSQPSTAQARPPVPPPCAEQQLQSVRQLINTLTADTRLPRRQTHDTQE
jgi:hypothetical protein